MKPRKNGGARVPASPVKSRQETPADIVSDLMGAIRRQFFADLPDSAWYPQQRFILRNVVLWPARWLDNKGVTLKPERYKQILLGIFDEIKRFGQTGAVKFWPGYLMKCVQDHFKIQGETYYEEGKALRAVLEKSMMAVTRAHDAPRGPDPIEILSQAQAALRPLKRKPKARPSGQCFLAL